MLQFHEKNEECFKAWLVSPFFFLWGMCWCGHLLLYFAWLVTPLKINSHSCFTQNSSKKPPWLGPSTYNRDFVLKNGACEYYYIYFPYRVSGPLFSGCEFHVSLREVIYTFKKPQKTSSMIFIFFRQPTLPGKNGKKRWKLLKVPVVLFQNVNLEEHAYLGEMFCFFLFSGFGSDFFGASNCMIGYK